MSKLDLFEAGYDTRPFTSLCRRFRWFVSVFALCCAMPLAARAGDLRTLFPEPVYVDMQQTGDIEEFPRQVVWHGYPDCHYVEVGPKGNLLMISGFKTGRIYFADAHNGLKLATVRIGRVVQGVNISPTGQLGVAVDTSAGAIKLINLRDFKVTRTIPVGRMPHNLVFSKHGHLAYVSVQGADKIAVVDIRAGKVLRDIPLPGMTGPHNLALSPDGRTLWVRNHPAPHQDGTVAVVDLATGRVKRYIRVGLFHGGMDVLADGKLAFTTDIGGDTVDAISTRSLKVVRRIDVGAGPHGVRSSDNGRYVYSATTRGNQLAVIDTRTLKVLRRIPLHGRFGFWLAVRGRP